MSTRQGRAADRRAAKLAEKMSQLTGRTCGECTACCFRLEVDEIEKPSCQHCPHELEKRGCAIYQKRPDQCRDWCCAWMLGIGTAEDRPDRSGVLVAPPADDNGHLWTFYNVHGEYAVPLDGRRMAAAIATRCREVEEQTGQMIPCGMQVGLGGQVLIILPPDQMDYYRDKERDGEPLTSIIAFPPKKEGTT